jgi:hypothetical protein
VPAPVARGLWAGVLAALVALTAAQVRFWRDSVVLWEHTVAVTERNIYGHERLSIAYRRVGRTEEANFHTDEAIRLIYARNRIGRPGQ